MAEGQQLGQLVRAPPALAGRVAVADQGALDDLAVGRDRRVQRERLLDLTHRPLALWTEEGVGLADRPADPTRDVGGGGRVEDHLGLALPDPEQGGAQRVGGLDVEAPLPHRVQELGDRREPGLRLPGRRLGQVPPVVDQWVGVERQHRVAPAAHVVEPPQGTLVGRHLRLRLGPAQLTVEPLGVLLPPGAAHRFAPHVHQPPVHQHQVGEPVEIGSAG